MKHKLHKIGRNKKYKRFLAAFAGAAVMSSAMLTNIPVAKAHTVNPSPRYYSNNRSAVYVHINHANDPVQVVKDNAAAFGFNAETDRFSLSSHTKDKAIVNVRTHEQSFKVDLIKNGDIWEIKTIRGIGDANHPATYRPASMFPYRAVAVGPVTDAPQITLYQNNHFGDWYWNKSFYPDDMGFGLIFQSPLLTQTANKIPASILSQLKNIDFGNKFVIYAHLGTISAKGYGIGIEEITQIGNDFIVTVRTLSPHNDETLQATKSTDLITLDRSVLNFEDPIIFKFIDHRGNVLAAYTLYQR